MSAGLYTDADAGYDYITKMRGIRPEAVVLYGQSLGTAVAADLASRKKLRPSYWSRGLVLPAIWHQQCSLLLPRIVSFPCQKSF